MKHSVLALYIILGNAQDAPRITEERPEIGLFSVYNVITEREEWALVYATDAIRGKDADKIRAEQGFLPPNGIGSINERADFKLGGGQVLQSGTRFKIDNTGALRAALNDLGVDVTGRQVYVVEYTWDEPNSAWEIEQAEIEPNPLFAGRADAPTWGKTTLEFQAVPAFEAQRRSNVSIDDRPVAFGGNRYGVNIKQNESQYFAIELRSGGGSSMTAVPIWQDAPFGHEVASADDYGGRLGLEILSGYFEPLGEEWAGLSFIGAVVTMDGDVVNAPIYGFREGVNPATLRRYIMLILDAPPDSISTPNTIAIMRARVAFSSDAWRNVTVDEPIDNTAYFINKNNQLEPFRPYGGLQSDVRNVQGEAGVLYRTLELREVLDADIDTVTSFFYSTSSRVSHLAEQTSLLEYVGIGRLLGWAMDGDDFDGYKMIESGVYVGTQGTSTITRHERPGPDSFDGSLQTFSDHGFIANLSVIGRPPLYAVVVTLPNPPEGISVDRVYLQIMASISAYSDVTLSVRVRDGNKVIATGIGDFLGEIPADTSAFLNSHINAGSLLPNYHSFELSGLDFSNGRPKSVLLLFTCRGAGNNKGIMLRTYEVGVLYASDVDTSKLLMPAPGRLTDSTWGGRRDVTNRIYNPIMLIEMMLRLSNWSETAQLTASAGYDGWGKGYAPAGYTELIDTAAFDSPPLLEMFGVFASRQIVNPDDADNTSIVQSLCADFYIGHKNRLPSSAWFGEVTMPHEAIFSIDTPEDAEIVPIVGLRELIDAGVEVREPSAKDIYCEPSIKYGYVEGLGYTQEMAVTNINMPAWRAEYTRGLNAADGREVWETCRDIFTKYRTFAEMPSGLIEQEWINDGGLAFGYGSRSYNNALAKLKKILTWMQYSRTSIKVPWEVGRKWAVGTHVKIAVPHIIGGRPFLCVVESIAKTRYGNSPNVACDLIILDNLDGMKITSFKAMSASGASEIYSDEELMTVSWATQNAVFATLTDADTGEVIYEGGAVNGSVMVPLVASTEVVIRNFTLTIRDRSGNEVNETLLVEILGSFVVEGALTAVPNNYVIAPAWRTWRWLVLNADEVTIDGVAVAHEGEEEVFVDRDITRTLRAYTDNRRYRGTLVRYIYKLEGIDIGAWVRGTLGPSRPSPIIPVPPAGVMTETMTVKAVGIILDSVTGTLGPRRAGPIIPIPPDGVMTEEDVVYAAGILFDSVEGSLGPRRAQPIIPIPPDGVMTEEDAVNAAGIIIESVSGSLGPSRPAPIIPTPPDGVMTESFTPVAGIIIETISGSLGPRS